MIKLLTVSSFGYRETNKQFNEPKNFIKIVDDRKQRTKFIPKIIQVRKRASLSLSQPWVILMVISLFLSKAIQPRQDPTAEASA